MENSPPGIQTMPSGVGPDGERLFATVGRKPAATRGEGAGLTEASVGWEDGAHAAKNKAAAAVTTRALTTMTVVSG